MGDPQIFGAGVFVSLWLVSFFWFSSHELRKGYQVKEPRKVEATDTNRRGLPLRAIPKHP